MRATFLSALLLSSLLVPLHADDPTHSISPAAQGPAVKGGFKNVNVQEFEKLRGDNKNVILDVRTPKEYAAGHMHGAVNIDFNAADFDKKIAALDAKKTYLVHCAAGVRSAKACDKLSKLRFPNLYNLEGGMRAWEKAGNKAER